MNINRRHFCLAVAVGSTPAVIGSGAAQSSVSVSGSITSAVGADVGGIRLYFSKTTSNASKTVTIPTDGTLDLTLPETGTYNVTLWNGSTRNRNIPVVYAFSNLEIDGSETTVSYTIPAAYETEIRCVDSTGTPISRLPVNFRAANGTGIAPGLFTTTTNGYVKAFGVTETGVELSGRVTIEIQPPSELSKTTRLSRETITESGTLEYTVANPDQYTYNFQIIEANPQAGFRLPYLLYQPEVSGDIERPLYVKPNNDTAVTTREELVTQLITAVDSAPFAGAVQNGFPGIIPGFPRTSNDGPDYIQTLTLPSYKSELISPNYRLDNLATDAFNADKLRRIDKQLLAMIEDAKNRLAAEPYPVADKIHMSGFSASTTFSNRFAFLYPDMVRTLTTGGSCVLPVPTNSINGTSLPYPLGTADYTQLTNKEFDEESWANIDRYIYVGREDQPLPGTDSRSYYYGSGRYTDTAESVFGINRVTERFPFVKSQYTEASDQATFEIYDGVGHRISQAMEDTLTTFHQTNAPVNDVRLSNVHLQPTTIGSSQSHTLTFDVENLSADGQPDTFSIAIPDTVIIERIDAVTADGLANPAVPAPTNPIRFSVDPTAPPRGKVTFTVELTLSKTTN